MVVKKIGIIAGVVIAIPVLLLLISYLYSEIQFTLVVKKRISDLPEYYQNVANNCIKVLPTKAQADQQECCLNSLRQMAQGDYKRAPLAFTDDPSRGCGARYVKLHCPGSLEWCDEKSDEYPLTENLQENNIKEYRGKDMILDDSLLIKIPQSDLIGQESYTLRNEKEEGDFSLAVPVKRGFRIEKINYLTSLGVTEDLYGQANFYSVFTIYKLPLDLGDIKLIDWLGDMQKRNLPDGEEGVFLGEDIGSSTRLLKSGNDFELAWFHMPVFSDNGWYVYKNSQNLYFFSMGNSSYAVNGMKSGLWDEVMSSIRKVEAENTFSVGIPEGWSRFSDKQLGLEFSYPIDWQVVKKSDGRVILNSTSNQQALKDIESGKMYGEGYMPSITIKRWNSVADEEENKANKLGAKTVPEMINANIFISGPQRVLLQGKGYWAATRGGFGAYYTIFVDEGKSYFEIMFGYKEENTQLDDIEKEIVSSMKFR